MVFGLVFGNVAQLFFFIFSPFYLSQISLEELENHFGLGKFLDLVLKQKMWCGFYIKFIWYNWICSYIVQVFQVSIRIVNYKILN